MVAALLAAYSLAAYEAARAARQAHVCGPWVFGDRDAAGDADGMTDLADPRADLVGGSSKSFHAVPPDHHFFRFPVIPTGIPR